MKRTEAQADRDKPFVLMYNGQMCRMLSYPIRGGPFKYEFDAPSEVAIQSLSIVRKTWWRRLWWDSERRMHELATKFLTKLPGSFMMSVRR